MPSNPFADHSAGLSGPAAHIRPVVKSDTADLPGGTCRALLVGIAGTANFVDASGATLIGVPLQQGYNPIGVTRVTTGGTAGDIWALY